MRGLRDRDDLRQLRQSTRELADAGVRLAEQIAVRERATVLLHQAQKMEVVGQLTGGLAAYDFSQLPDDHRRQPRSDPPACDRHACRAAAGSGSGRGAARRRRLQQLLAFSRIQTLRRSASGFVDLLPQVERTIALSAWTSRSPSIRPPACGAARCGSEPANPPSSTSPSMRATPCPRAAAPGRSRPRTPVSDADRARQPGEVEPREVATALADTGAGRSAQGDVLARLRFFSTRDVGAGSAGPQPGLRLCAPVGRDTSRWSTARGRGGAARPAVACSWTAPVEAVAVKEADAIAAAARAEQGPDRGGQ